MNKPTPQLPDELEVVTEERNAALLEVERLTRERDRQYALETEARRMYVRAAEERDEALAAIERVRAVCESWDVFANRFEARLLDAVKEALAPVAPAGDVERAAGGVRT